MLCLALPCTSSLNRGQWLVWNRLLSEQVKEFSEWEVRPQDHRLFTEAKVTELVVRGRGWDSGPGPSPWPPHQPAVTLATVVSAGGVLPAPQYCVLC